MDKLKKLRVITLDYPYKVWDQPEMFDHLQKIISVKLKGYHHEFSSDTLPVDVTDFIGIHQSVCMEIDKKLHPIMVFKTTPLSRCKTHRVTFPLLSMAQQAKSQPHIEVISEIIKAAEMNNREIAYSGCWTVDPKYRKDREFAKQLREITMATYMYTHHDFNIDEHLVSATLKFKTDSLFSDYGHTFLQKNGIQLPSLYLHHLFDAEAKFMYVRKFSEFAESIANKWLFLWDGRTYIGSDEAKKQKKKVA